MGIDPLTQDEVLTTLAEHDATAVPTATLAAMLKAPKPYVTTHLQQLALQDLVGFNTHEGVRRGRLTPTGARTLQEPNDG